MSVIHNPQHKTSDVGGDFALAGHLAGDKAGKQFQQWCQDGKEPATFGVGSAVVSAHTQMRAAGAGDLQVAAWTIAFHKAFISYAGIHERLFPAGRLAPYLQV